MNHCSAWRTKPGHAKSSVLLPRGGKRKILLSSESEISEELRDFQMGERKKSLPAFKLDRLVDCFVEQIIVFGIQA